MPKPTTVTPRRRALRLFSVSVPTAGTCRPAGLDSVRPDPKVFLSIDYASYRADANGYVIARREDSGKVTVLKTGTLRPGTGYAFN